ncbi:hypothetical protein bcgnr5380_60240 [Bacillus cereus]
MGSVPAVGATRVATAGLPACVASSLPQSRLAPLLQGLAGYFFKVRSNSS